MHALLCSALLIGCILPSSVCFPLAEMFQRSHGACPASSSGAPASQLLKDDIQDLFAENMISGRRAFGLLDKAKDAGVKIAIKQIKKLPGVKKKFVKNFARDLRRKMKKNDHWPEPYSFECRLWNPKTRKEITERICIFLPSDILEMIWDFGIKEVLLGMDNYDKITKEHYAWMKQELNASVLWGFGLHGDGVPCNYDRTESVIITSINLPGLTGRNGRLRVPLLILPDWAVSKNTYDDCYEVIAWDMRNMLTGCRAACRHDGTAWDPHTDKKRSMRTGNLPFKACLVQVRADWDWLTKCYHFPGHGSKEGFCWLCSCPHRQVLIVHTYKGPLSQGPL